MGIRGLREGESLASETCSWGKGIVATQTAASRHKFEGRELRLVSGESGSSRCDEHVFYGSFLSERERSCTEVGRRLLRFSGVELFMGIVLRDVGLDARAQAELSVPQGAG